MAAERRSRPADRPYGDAVPRDERGRDEAPRRSLRKPPARSRGAAEARTPTRICSGSGILSEVDHELLAGLGHRACRRTSCRAEGICVSFPDEAAPATRAPTPSGTERSSRASPRSTTTGRSSSSRCPSSMRNTMAALLIARGCSGGGDLGRNGERATAALHRAVPPRRGARADELQRARRRVRRTARPRRLHRAADVRPERLPADDRAGLRGPRNGGTERCLLVNVADNVEQFGEQLAFHEFDYLWDGPPSRGSQLTCVRASFGRRPTAVAELVRMSRSS